MSDPILRRGFLRQLCSLPMLGGGLALLGAPTAVAEPVTSGMLDAYRSFLIGELNLLERERPRELFAPYVPCPEVSKDDPAYLLWAEEVIAVHKERGREVHARHLRRMAMPVFRSPSSTRAALVADHIFAAIEEHKRLRSAAYYSGVDEGPEYEAACVEEESALQALSRLKPITVGGACALLKYMANVEGCFVRNTGSPLLKTVLTVANALKAIERRQL
jgi:hypothetical protein